MKRTNEQQTNRMNWREESPANRCFMHKWKWNYMVWCAIALHYIIQCLIIGAQWNPAHETHFQRHRSSYNPINGCAWLGPRPAANAICARKTIPILCDIFFVFVCKFITETRIWIIALQWVVEHQIKDNAKNETRTNVNRLVRWLCTKCMHLTGFNCGFKF